jgi:hypothetical protein
MMNAEGLVTGPVLSSEPFPNEQAESHTGEKQP